MFWVELRGGGERESMVLMRVVFGKRENEREKEEKVVFVQCTVEDRTCIKEKDERVLRKSF